jgi:hypothetical protein
MAEGDASLSSPQNSAGARLSRGNMVAAGLAGDGLETRPGLASGERSQPRSPKGMRKVVVIRVSRNE